MVVCRSSIDMPCFTWRLGDTTWTITHVCTCKRNPVILKSDNMRTLRQQLPKHVPCTRVFLCWSNASFFSSPQPINNAHTVRTNAEGSNQGCQSNGPALLNVLCKSPMQPALCHKLHITAPHLCRGRAAPLPNHKLHLCLKVLLTNRIAMSVGDNFNLVS